MYMHPISAFEVKQQSQRPVALKLVAGLLFFAAALIVMPLWWLATAAWLAGGGAIGAARSIGRSSFDCLIYAGEAVVGR